MIIASHSSPRAQAQRTLCDLSQFSCLRQIRKNLKDSYYTTLKSVVFDCWFDMFTDSWLMATAIKFDLQRNSGSVLQCDDERMNGRFLARIHF